MSFPSSNSSSPPSLKCSQLSAIDAMLSMHADDPSSSTPNSNQWKVLIYDAPCRAIISPLLSVSQLRSRGVTLHLLMSSPREPIPDVPAVYFCEPTRANLSIIASDLASGLYSRSYLNFVTKLPRHLMEEFAKLVVGSGPEALSRIVSIRDLYLDYVCYEHNLFSLNKEKSYVRYNGSGITEEGIDKEMSEVAYGLFSVVASMGSVPVIRCPHGGSAEMVARKLNVLIRENAALMRGGRQVHDRPLLVIMDRNADLVTAIQHTSTYQALIDDVLKHHANRVEFQLKADPTVAGGQERFVPKKYDLDPDRDPFYSNHKFNPFPEAIESNGVELQKVTNREMEVRSKTSHTNSNENAAPVVQMDNQPTELTKAISSLPALLEHKKQLEIHTTILQAVMNEVAKRDIPLFYELESDIATGKYKNDLPGAKKQVQTLLEDPTKGSSKDKIRLLAVYTLATSAPSQDIQHLIQCIQQCLTSQPDQAEQKHLDQGIKSIGYLKKLRSITKTQDLFQDDTNQNQNVAPPKSGNASADLLSNFMARAQTQATGLLAKATEKVGTILGKTNKHHLTRVVENLIQNRQEDEVYLYLDPKVKGGELDVTKFKQRAELTGSARGQVREVIAFMIGGGCYAEYQNLKTLIEGYDESGPAGYNVNVCYGGTELVSSDAFLAQLGELG